jgi:hypothetical protein
MVQLQSESKVNYDIFAGLALLFYVRRQIDWVRYSTTLPIYLYSIIVFVYVVHNDFIAPNEFL